MKRVVAVMVTTKRTINIRKSRLLPCRKKLSVSIRDWCSNFRLFQVIPILWEQGPLREEILSITIKYLENPIIKSSLKTQINRWSTR
jgi:hypothetical protein